MSQSVPSREVARRVEPCARVDVLAPQGAETEARTGRSDYLVPVRSQCFCFTARLIDDGTAVDISRIQLSRTDFKTLAEAITVTARIGSARFFVDWMTRRDMRLILDDVPADSSRPVSSRESD